MADEVKLLDRAIKQLEAKMKKSGKVPALAGTGSSLEKVPIGHRARARGVRIPDVKVKFRGGKRRHARKTRRTKRRGKR